MPKGLIIAIKKESGKGSMAEEARGVFEMIFEKLLSYEGEEKAVLQQEIERFIEMYEDYKESEGETEDEGEIEEEMPMKPDLGSMMKKIMG